VAEPIAAAREAKATGGGVRMNERQVDQANTPEADRGELTHDGRSLRWYRSPNGVWCVCADDAAPVCACGLSIAGAVRQWERAQRQGE
jgi:hypothetical protein